MAHRDDKVKTAEGKRVRFHHLTYELGHMPDSIPGVGTEVSGGGVVTGASGTSFTVEFPNGVAPRYVQLPDVETTVIIVYTVASAESSGPGIGVVLGGGGPFIGQTIESGGVVTAFTDTTVTIQFPNGVPQGPIELPWVETTVVDETSPSDGGDEPAATAPFGAGDVVASFAGASTFVAGTPSQDGRHKLFLMPCPGTTENAIVIQDRFLLAPTHASNCGCAIFLASLDSGGNVIGESTKIRRGQSLATFELAPGGAAISVACSALCSTPGCVGVLQVSLGDA